MTYQELIADFNQKGSPGANGATPNSSAWNDAFNRYYGTIMAQHGVGDWADIQPDWVANVTAPATPTQMSDADFLNYVTQVADVESDPAMFNRLTTLADGGNQTAIQALTNAGYENSSPTTNMPIEQGILNQILPSLLKDIEGDDARRALIAQLSGQATDDYNTARNALSPEENARRLAEELAQADKTSGLLSDSAATSAAQQLKALQDSIASMQQNLTGDLAAKAAALQQQLESYRTNLSTLDATQKAALEEQIAANKQNLETSIAAQKENLGSEIAKLRGAADANSLARAAALQTELAGLTAAQAPLNQARLDSANAVTSGINLGLQNTNDQLTAQRAKQGYLGGSSFDQANLARAAIGARQQAAQVMGGAREANATDDRTIGSYGASQGRSLADEYANNLMALTGRSATGERSLSDLLAQGTQQIGDTGAAGLATIKNNTGTGLFGINNAGATQTYQDVTGGSSKLKDLLDALAKGTGSIATTQATQQQDARDTGTNAKQGYFDNAYTRGQGAILSRPGLSTNLASTLTSLGNYGSTGLNRSLNALNWWAGNGQAAPTSGYTPVTANNSGNDIAGLGAGLLGAGLNVGNANNWWQTPKKTTTNSAYTDMVNAMNANNN